MDAIGVDEDAAEGEVKDEAALKEKEEEVKEVVEDLEKDESEVVQAPDDDKVVNEEENDVQHDQAIIGVQAEDMEELMADIRDDEMDRDADVIEKKLNDIKFAKENNAKSDLERRKLELERKQKRNITRKLKHEARKKKHAERHAKIDQWLVEMRQEHPNKRVK